MFLVILNESFVQYDWVGHSAWEIASTPAIFYDMIFMIFMILFIIVNELLGSKG